MEDSWDEILLRFVLERPSVYKLSSFVTFFFLFPIGVFTTVVPNIKIHSCMVEHFLTSSVTNISGKNKCFGQILPTAPRRLAGQARRASTPHETEPVRNLRKEKNSNLGSQLCLVIWFHSQTAWIKQENHPFVRQPDCSKNSDFFWWEKKIWTKVLSTFWLTSLSRATACLFHFVFQRHHLKLEPQSVR